MTVDARALWLTGRSDPRSALLSPVQHRVLDALAELGWSTVRVGQPWDEPDPVARYVQAPLLRASIRNAGQFLAGRPGGELAAQVAAGLQPLVTGTRRRLIVLAGSAGARLLSSAAPLLELPPGLRVEVIGVGPVGRLPGAPWRVRVLRGRWDAISAFGYPGRSDRTVPGGHLSATASPEALATIRDWAGEAAR